MNEVVRGLARKVWITLGPGYSERIYHNAMEVGFRGLQIPYQTERIVPVMFDGHAIGNIRADLILNSSMIIELKSVKALKEEHRTQTRMYMRLLDIAEGMLINFPNSDGDLEVENIKILLDV